MMVRRQRARRAVVVPLVLAAVAIFLAVLTILVDGGLMLLAHGELEGLAEVAALAGAAATPAQDDVEQAVATFIENNVSGGQVTKVVVTGSQVTVVLSRPVHLLVSRRFANGLVDITSAATAIREGGRLRLLP